ncbi:hypothetical protein HDU97_006644 [Phlyctochytrium planicorne]|nr:hypothetical protein HDU97_006644 [Phlyctochytrium planicorne]
MHSHQEPTSPNSITSNTHLAPHSPVPTPPAAASYPDHHHAKPLSIPIAEEAETAYAQPLPLPNPDPVSAPSNGHALPPPVQTDRPNGYEVEDPMVVEDDRFKYSQQATYPAHGTPQGQLPLPRPQHLATEPVAASRSPSIEHLISNADSGSMDLDPSGYGAYHGHHHPAANARSISSPMGYGYGHPQQHVPSLPPMIQQTAAPPSAFSGQPPSGIWKPVVIHKEDGIQCELIVPSTWPNGEPRAGGDDGVSADSRKRKGEDANKKGGVKRIKSDGVAMTKKEKSKKRKADLLKLYSLIKHGGKKYAGFLTSGSDSDNSGSGDEEDALAAIAKMTKGKKKRRKSSSDAAVLGGVDGGSTTSKKRSRSNSTSGGSSSSSSSDEDEENVDEIDWNEGEMPVVAGRSNATGTPGAGKSASSSANSSQANITAVTPTTIRLKPPSAPSTASTPMTVKKKADGVDVLAPRRIGLWTEEETARLVQAVQKHGTQWVKVAKEVGDREASQCENKWRRLDPSKVDSTSLSVLPPTVKKLDGQSPAGAPKKGGPGAAAAGTSPGVAASASKSASRKKKNDWQPVLLGVPAKPKLGAGDQQNPSQPRDDDGSSSSSSSGSGSDSSSSGSDSSSDSEDEDHKKIVPIPVPTGVIAKPPPAPLFAQTGAAPKVDGNESDSSSSSGSSGSSSGSGSDSDSDSDNEDTPNAAGGVKVVVAGASGLTTVRPGSAGSTPIPMASTPLAGKASAASTPKSGVPATPGSGGAAAAKPKSSSKSASKASSAGGGSASASASAAALAAARVKVWTREEDAKLLRAVKLFGNKWEKVEMLVPGRNRRQCKDHWNRVLAKKDVAKEVHAQNIAVKNAASVIAGGPDYQALAEDEDPFGVLPKFSSDVDLSVLMTAKSTASGTSTKHSESKKKDPAAKAAAVVAAVNSVGKSSAPAPVVASAGANSTSTSSSTSASGSLKPSFSVGSLVGPKPEPMEGVEHTGGALSAGAGGDGPGSPSGTSSSSSSSSGGDSRDSSPGSGSGISSPAGEGDREASAGAGGDGM